MVVAILIAGIWAIWKALVQRRYSETAGALAISVVFVVIALFFVYQPQHHEAADEHGANRNPSDPVAPASAAETATTTAMTSE